MGGERSCRAGQGDARAGGEAEGCGVRGWASPNPFQRSALLTPLWEVMLGGIPVPGRAPAALPCGWGPVKEAGGIPPRAAAPFPRCYLRARRQQYHSLAWPARLSLAVPQEQPPSPPVPTSCLHTAALRDASFVRNPEQLPAQEPLQGM